MIVDNKSDADQSLIKAAAKILHENNIQVIPVAVGKEADTKELLATTEDVNSLIDTPKDFVSAQLGDKIMKGVLEGNYEQYIFFTVLCLVTRLLNESEAGVDLSLIQMSLLFLCNSCCCNANCVVR